MWALSGSGPDGAEEIKRHVFYSTIDWNVSMSGQRVGGSANEGLRPGGKGEGTLLG